MVLTAAQTTAFFEDADQMAIPHATAVELQNEGINTVNDLEKFDKDQLDQIAQNIRRPSGRRCCSFHVWSQITTKTPCSHQSGEILQHCW